jgi:hypothetical protein
MNLSPVSRTTGLPIDVDMPVDGHARRLVGHQSQAVLIAPPTITAPQAVTLPDRATSAPSTVNFGEPVWIAFGPWIGQSRVSPTRAIS